MGQTAAGGTFRTRLGAARMFGLIETGQGRVSLTQLGRDSLTNSGSEQAARVSAFLNVELFRAMYEQYRANVLPPPPAIERQVAQLGVSPKRTERARQTFMKCAQYAGLLMLLPVDLLSHHRHRRQACPILGAAKRLRRLDDAARPAAAANQPVLSDAR
jgi:hypothetical protein